MKFCLDKIKMNVIQTANNGIVNHGTLDNGVSLCKLSKNENGKIILTEHFEWNCGQVSLGQIFFKKFN